MEISPICLSKKQKIIGEKKTTNVLCRSYMVAMESLDVLMCGLKLSQGILQWRRIQPMLTFVIFIDS
jgi:hypothetical protein